MLKIDSERLRVLHPDQQRIDAASADLLRRTARLLQLPSEAPVKPASKRRQRPNR